MHNPRAISLLRALLTMIVLAAMIGLPLLMSPPGVGLSGRTAQAAPASGPDAGPALDRHPERRNRNENGNGNGNGNRNDNSDNGNGNDNDNGNSNNNDNDCDDNDDVHHDRHRGFAPSSPPSPPPSVVSRCYASGEAGAITLTLPGGNVALTVVPTSAFPRTSQVTLAKSDPSAAPATPGTRLDAIVFEVRALDGCDGGALGELPADANLGLRYTVPATSSALRFAIWDGARWLDVPTVPDPNPANPYVSATIRRTGVYTVYQMP